MCGIFGIYGENKRTAWDLYDKFKNVMHDRGPDSFNPLEYGSLSLLHSRLAIIDLSSGGNQPFKNERYAFAYNGELYNYTELARSEGIDGKSDGQVFFHMLCKYGMKCLDQLDGMWDFAFYDIQNNELFLCRDRFGEKPLFTYGDNRTLL